MPTTGQGSLQSLAPRACVLLLLAPALYYALPLHPLPEVALVSEDHGSPTTIASSHQVLHEVFIVHISLMISVIVRVT
jgi:hypothetical protein